MSKRIRTRINAKYTAACLLVGKIAIRAFLLVMALVVVGCMVDSYSGTTSTAPVQTPPTSAPSTDDSGMHPHERPTQNPPAEGDGYEDGHLFDPAATLDTSYIDDLRDDPAGACIAQHRVYTRDGSCLPGVLVYPSDVPAEVFDRLAELGYEQVVDVNLSGGEAYGSLFVPENAVIAADGGRWTFTDEGAVWEDFPAR